MKPTTTLKRRINRSIRKATYGTVVLLGISFACGLMAMYDEHVHNKAELAAKNDEISKLKAALVSTDANAKTAQQIAYLAGPLPRTALTPPPDTPAVALQRIPDRLPARKPRTPNEG